MSWRKAMAEGNWGANFPNGTCRDVARCYRNPDAADHTSFDQYKQSMKSWFHKVRSLQNFGPQLDVFTEQLATDKKRVCSEVEGFLGLPRYFRKGEEVGV